MNTEISYLGELLPLTKCWECPAERQLWMLVRNKVLQPQIQAKPM